MTQELSAQILVPPSQRPLAGWRHALDGLTPQLLGIVAVLLLARLLAWPITDGSLGAADHFRLIARGCIQQLIMTAPMLLAIVVTRNLGPQHGWQRAAALAVAIVASAFFGIVLRYVLTNALFGFGPTFENMLSHLRSVWPRYVILGSMLTIALEFHQREVASIAATQKALVDREALERQLAESRLQVLQAQVEPHFLFNTLANVRRLYSTDPPRGRDDARQSDALLRRRAAAACAGARRRSATKRNWRAPTSTSSASAWARGSPSRSTSRRSFSAQVVPPMMLLTLVENAIKHGLNPAPDGGAIRVTAERHGGALQLKVADSGVGFVPGSGTGSGLANIRARLTAQFGARASLAVENNDLGGVTAIISLPCA